MFNPVRLPRSTRVALLAGAVAASPLAAGIAHAADAPAARHVVVVVWDGLRPDSINDTDTPTLARLAHEGAFFAHHHPVYLSSTEVNGSALATGGYPEHTGIMGNLEYRPKIELLKPINTESLNAVRKGDALTGGLYLRMPTLAETIRAAGHTTVIAGTKPVALLLDRAERTSSASPSLFAGKTLPTDLVSTLVPADNPFPKVADATLSANARQDEWTTRMLTTRLWAHGIPTFTTLWLSEPDFAQHGSGPGSAVAKAALKSSDDNLARVIESLTAANALDSTDLFVVSDHGFSTIARNVSVSSALKSHGFNPLKSFQSTSTPDDVVVVGNGGSVSLYVPGHDPAVIKRLAEFLQTTDFAGVLFTRQELPGTFPLHLATVDTPDAPDLLMSLRWTDGKSATGMPGLIASEGTARGPGQGNHASLSSTDMHNTLVAFGPDIRPHFTDTLPTGNVDLAPTVLAILGITPPASAPTMDGRVLGEALIHGQTPGLASTTRFTAFTPVPGGQWSQYLQTTTCEQTTYIDEGNGHLLAEQASR